MKTMVFVCPFAQFGNGGTQAGAELLADAVRELLHDGLHDRRPMRGDVFAEKVTVRELPLKSLADVQAWKTRARQAAKNAIDEGHFLVWIGGNHLGVQPVYEELGGRVGSLVVQLDAHLDVYHYDDVLVEESHGNFLRHAESLPGIVNIGHRDLFLPGTEIRKYFRQSTSAADLANNEAAVLRDLKSRVKSAKRTFLDIDVDVLDPAFMPAVVDALPFGVTPQQLLRITNAVWSKKLVGVSICEFDPGRDQNDRGGQLLMWYIEHLLLRLYE